MFESTPWSAVVAAGQLNPALQNVALERLCQLYWRPLYTYVRRRIQDADLAQDLTQSFFESLLSGNALRLADPARGRFRTFLIHALNWHLANENRDKQTVKRGGRNQTFAVDFSEVQAIADHHSLTAEQLFDRDWAMALLNLAMLRLRDEQSSPQKLEHFEQLKVFLSGDRVEGGYQQVAQRLGMSEASARMAASRLRARYREILREEILATVASSQDIDDEIRHMFAVLSLPG